MEIAITKMSSKGQIVIPMELRTDIEEGEKLLIIKNGDRIILKKSKALNKQLQEDVKFAKKTEEALKRYENNEFKTKKFEDFIKEIKKW